jgi:hypothetical protein
MSAPLRATVVWVLVAAGCQHRIPAPPSADLPVQAPGLAETTAVGTVRVIGTDPQPQIVIQAEDGSRRALVGAASLELAQLGGARVRVRGRAVATSAPVTTGVAVESYEILEVAGAKPIVGRVQSRGGILFIDTTQVESPPPPELARAIGGKAWAIGRPGPSGLVVTAYGILASAPADSTGP